MLSVIASDPRRFARAVLWYVTATDPFGDERIHRVEARSAEKAARAMRRIYGVHLAPISAAAQAPRLVRRGALLADLPVDEEVRAKGTSGAWWVICRYSDGQIGLDTGKGAARRGTSIPAHAASELCTVGEALELGACAIDHPGTVAAVANLILHGIVLQAPARLQGVTAASVGAHPDNGGGFAAVLDPGGPFEVTTTTVVYSDIERDERITSDRSAFDAAFYFVDAVGCGAARWAIEAARREGRRPW